MANVTLKGNPIHTVGELPKVGSPGPNFRLTRGDLSEHLARRLRGQGGDPQHRAQPRHRPGGGLGAHYSRFQPARSTGVRPETARYAHRVQDRMLPTPSPPPVGRGNKLLDSRYFFPSQREGIEGWAREFRKPKRDGYIAILTPGHPC